MKNYSVKIDGKNVLYKGSVLCVVTARLSIWQRVKILLGGKVIVTTQVFTKEWATPVGQISVSAVAWRLPEKEETRAPEAR